MHDLGNIRQIPDLRNVDKQPLFCTHAKKGIKAQVERGGKIWTIKAGFQKSSVAGGHIHQIMVCSVCLRKRCVHHSWTVGTGLDCPIGFNSFNSHTITHGKSGTPNGFE